jgi:phosphoglycolate phosphatase-like HAD superfamily hydrolase
MNYKYHLFDCDGVILNSNQIKSKVFHEITSSYSNQFADEATEYYKNTAGTPRVDKVYYFFEKLMKIEATEELIQEFLNSFNNTALNNLFVCDKITGVQSYLNSIKDNSKSFVVSGAPQDELRTILSKQELDHYFEEILGSPVKKPDNIESLLNDYQLDPKNCVFYGDSKVDYLSASKFNIDFIFVSEKTEFKDYKDFFKDKDIRTIKNFNELL